MEIGKKPTIFIGTTFYKYDPAYSVCAVVWDQLHVLVKNGYKTVLLVLPSFQDDAMVPAGVEIRKVIPQILLEPYKGFEFPSHYKEDIVKVREMIEKNLQDADFLITHDWHFIDTYIPYWTALRESIPNLPNLKQILAWTHSAPSTRPNLENNIHANRYTMAPKTKLVYLNHDKIIDLAEMVGGWAKDVRVVHNSRDPRTCWNLDPFVNKLIDKYDLLSADIISVYPVSTPRMISGKGVDKVIKIHSKLKELGYKTRLIVCSAHANANRDKGMIADLYVWAADMNINKEELIFTSLEEVPKYEQGVPANIVSDLFRLSNIFIFPTISENSSLVMAEAMLASNLLVLNKNVGTLREHAGEKAIYFDFTYRENIKDNENYFLDLAKNIASEFENDKALQVKRRVFQKQNYDAMFKEMERLFYESEE